ncbi:MAG: hypothetical protein CMM52_15355 [Rhodospirillaceae bacterium]|nr:hypothetical protein [Rhodospirillaceae bacterium]|tara:strand:+ start:24178 stop:24468 length:291 start_codon:yes stop_codon:yes gene_type:complete
MDHNPYIKSGGKKNAVTGRGSIEEPSAIVNVPWQTRSAPPTEYELALSEALTEIFGAGAEALPDIVAALNEKGVKAPDGSDWTEDSFKSEMKTLSG